MSSKQKESAGASHLATLTTHSIWNEEPWAICFVMCTSHKIFSLCESEHCLWLFEEVEAVQASKYIVFERTSDSLLAVTRQFPKPFIFWPTEYTEWLVAELLHVHCLGSKVVNVLTLQQCKQSIHKNSLHHTSYDHTSYNTHPLATQSAGCHRQNKTSSTHLEKGVKSKSKPLSWGGVIFQQSGFCARYGPLTRFMSQGSLRSLSYRDTGQVCIVKATPPILLDLLVNTWKLSSNSARPNWTTDQCDAVFPNQHLIN